MRVISYRKAISLPSDAELDRKEEEGLTREEIRDIYVDLITFECDTAPITSDAVSDDEYRSLLSLDRSDLIALVKERVHDVMHELEYVEKIGSDGAFSDFRIEE